MEKKTLKTMLWKTLVLSLLLPALTLAGCSSSANTSSSYEKTEDVYYEPAEAAAEEAGIADYDTWDEEAAMEADEPASANAGSGSSGADDLTEEAQVKMQEKLVYTCSLQMQTLTYSETMANIRSSIEKYGGIIQSENETNSDRYWYNYDTESGSGTMMIYLTVRIPTDKYYSFLTDMEGQGKILNKTSNVENISREYHDTEAIISNLEKQEERIQAMIEKAETVEEMILIEDRLAEVQTELDQYRTRLAGMDTDVAYSTINLSVEEVRRYTQDPPKRETFMDRLKNALKGSLENFLSLLEELLFTLIYLLPVAAVVAVIAVIIRAVYKAWRKKHPKKPKQPKAPRSFGMPKMPGGRNGGNPPAQGGTQPYTGVNYGNGEAPAENNAPINAPMGNAPAGNAPTNAPMGNAPAGNVPVNAPKGNTSAENTAVNTQKENIPQNGAENKNTPKNQ